MEHIGVRIEHKEVRIEHIGVRIEHIGVQFASLLQQPKWEQAHES